MAAASALLEAPAQVATASTGRVIAWGPRVLARADVLEFLIIGVKRGPARGAGLGLAPFPASPIYGLSYRHGVT